MRLFRKKSAWDSTKEAMAARRPDKQTVRSGLFAAGAAVGLTALSSAVSSMRKKHER